MQNLKGRTVTVAGAGALGLVTALRLVDAGAAVTVCDPALLADNASGVAAGMLAPVFESVLDHEGGDHFALLIAARDQWPVLAHRLRLEDLLDRSGAVLAGLAGDEAALATAAAHMSALGLAPAHLDGTALRRLQPGLAAGVVAGLLTRLDWRLDPSRALTALAAAIVEAGGRIVRARLEPDSGGFRMDGEQLRGAVVLTTGADAGDLATVAPELAVLSAIKGQILQFQGGPISGPVVRGLSGYVVPQPGGALAGATMEAGRRDRALDAATLARLRADAARLFPDLATVQAVGRAAVRAATPDGLPLVGRSMAVGEVVLCTGARRNGWLLAPLLADEVLRILAGGEPLPALNSRRFG